MGRSSFRQRASSRRPSRNRLRSHRSWPMDLLQPVVPEGADPQIHQPEVGQTRGDQQPTEACRVAEVALVQMEAPALLVGEEGCSGPRELSHSERLFTRAAQAGEGRPRRSPSRPSRRGHSVTGVSGSPSTLPATGLAVPASSWSGAQTGLELRVATRQLQEIGSISGPLGLLGDRSRGWSGQCEFAHRHVGGGGRERTCRRWPVAPAAGGGRAPGCRDEARGARGRPQPGTSGPVSSRADGGSGWGVK